MEFCPDCHTRLTYNPSSNHSLDCPRCGHESKLSKGDLLKIRHYEKAYDSNILILDNESLDLLTSQATDVYCERCGWKKVETWTVAVGSEDLSSITFFRCVSCGYTWRINDRG